MSKIDDRGKWWPGKSGRCLMIFMSTRIIRGLEATVRLWTFHPKYLDSKGLVALWREALLAQAVLKGTTKAYGRHPQLARFRRSRTPVRCIAAYLRVVHAEGSRRGFNFDGGKIARGGPVERITVTQGQIEYEWDHLMAKLRKRDPERSMDLRSVRKIDPHPLFKVIRGGVEDWEKTRGQGDAGGSLSVGMPTRWRQDAAARLR